MPRDVDPITLAVMCGVLETTQRKMPMTLEKNACFFGDDLHDGGIIYHNDTV